MAETFIISDTHFGHNNIITFKQACGKMVRDFASVEEMDDYMITQWNSVVREQDKVIHLGDVVINKRHLDVLAKLNGKKKLIMGNHDIFKLELYQKYFYDLKAYRVIDNYIMSHVPVHRESIGRFKANVHGHTHTNCVELDDGSIDPHYLSMCVEQPHVAYTPVPWYRVKEIFASRGIE